MSAQLRSELLKQRSTRSNQGLLAGMVALVAFVVLLHGFGLPTESLGGDSDQLQVLFGRGEMLGALFAGLLGALSITGEFRHGTIRPTLLVTPRRDRVVAAKVWASMLFGAAFGLIAAAVAAGVGSAALSARGVAIQPDGGDYALLLAGGAVAAALWAAIGVGLGAVIRGQVPTLVGICAWILFVEGLLAGDFGVIGEIGRFAPGALGAATSGQDPELAPLVGALLLALYAAAATVAGATTTTTRRDVA